MQKRVEWTTDSAARPSEEIPVKQLVIRNTGDLRLFLLDTMIKAVTGEIDGNQVANTCRCVQQIYNIGKLELAAAKVRAQFKSEDIKALEF